VRPRRFPSCRVADCPADPPSPLFPRSTLCRRPRVCARTQTRRDTTLNVVTTFVIVRGAGLMGFDRQLDMKNFTDAAFVVACMVLFVR
jgi:hypothetical protein